MLKIKIVNSVFLAHVLLLTFFNYVILFDIEYDDGIVQTILNNIYTVRDILLYSSILFLCLTRSFTRDSFIVIIGAIILYILTAILSPQNIEYFQEVSTYFILCISVFCVVRSKVFPLKTFIKLNRYVAILTVFLALWFFINNIGTLFFIQHYMVFSNAVSISTAVLISQGFASKNKIDLGLALVSYIMILLGGGRGAFVSLSLLAAIIFWNKYRSSKIIYCGIGVCLLFIIAPNFMVDILGYLSSIVDFDSRTISRLLSDDLLQGSDRYELYGYLCQCIQNDYFLGGGLCADRYYLTSGGLSDNGFYAHNILIEMMVDFGILGLISFGYIIYIFIYVAKKYRNEHFIFNYLLAFFIVGFFQLFFSRSFLTEPIFFIFVAYTIHYNNIKYSGHEETIG